MKHTSTGILLALQSIGVALAGSSSKTPLFDYEIEQLTDRTILHLSNAEKKEFAFDDSAVNLSPRTRAGQCKTFPGDRGWPSDNSWKLLNKLTNGALIKTTPLGAPCYQNWGVYDEAKCAEITNSFTSTYLHEADPTSNMFPFFQGRTCMPRIDANGTCAIGSFPEYAIDVSTVSQIQLGLNFARNKNLRLVIKNTGHDYLGKSLGAGALSIWTHNMKNIRFIENYKSDSGYRGPAFKVGAGVTVLEIYKAAHERGLMVAGGLCESVGYAGGYLAGGGHTPLSGYYGVGADSVEALQVVTADGRFVTASATSNSDLFWALRGGGGSTFGVVTSVIVRAYKSLPVVTSTFTFGTGGPGNVSKEVFWQGLRKFYEKFDAYAEAHLYSYFYVFPFPDGFFFQMTPIWAMNYTSESFNALVGPLYDELRELGIDITPNTTQYDSFFQAYTGTWPVGSTVNTVGDTVTLPGNRLLPEANWKDETKFENMMTAIKNHLDNGYMIIGYQQAPMNRLNVDNAVSSAFRHSRSLLISSSTVEGGEFANMQQLKAAADVLTNDIFGPLREVAPVEDFGGTYANEANVVEPRWQANFYGTQYPRLLRIKKKWDPKSVFYATTAVGSEDWEVRDGDWGTQTQNGRLCRVR